MNYIEYPSIYYLLGNSSISDIPQNTTKLFFATDHDDGSNELTIDNSFTKLEELHFSPKSEVSIRNLTIDGVPELHSISFGKYSCRMSSSSRNDGLLTISNLPKLMNIEIQDYALQDYSSVIFFNLSSLQTITIGSYAFQYSSSIQLSSWFIYIINDY